MSTTQRRLVLHRSSFTGLVGLTVLALAGCGGDSSGTSSPAPSAGPEPPPSGRPRAASERPVHGRFVGTVQIGEVDYFGDAILTVDGDARLYVGGGPYSASGALDTTRPANSVQFVANVETHSGKAFGKGMVIGQGCADLQGGRFCRQSAVGEISVTADGRYIRGEIRVATHSGNETWLLNLGRWENYYDYRAGQDYLAGQYQEVLAEFALDDDTVMTVDGTGQLFFQSAHSGCTGNGILTPHLDGSFGVYDVTLTLGNCKAPYDYLNGGFEGLATESPSNYWHYDSLLRIWLSSPVGAPSPAALMMSGSPIYTSHSLDAS